MSEDDLKVLMGLMSERKHESNESLSPEEQQALVDEYVDTLEAYVETMTRICVESELEGDDED